MQLEDLVREIRASGFLTASVQPDQRASCTEVLGVENARAVDALLVPALRKASPPACGQAWPQRVFVPCDHAPPSTPLPCRRLRRRQEQSQREQRDSLVIMMWPHETHFRAPRSPLEACPQPCSFIPPCPGLLSAADYILVHVPSIQQMGQGTPLLPPLPATATADCVQPWVFFSQESQSNYMMQGDAQFRSLFAYNMSYELDSSVPITYADRPYLSGFDYSRPASPHKDRRKQVVCIIGKCNSHTGRKEFVAQLGEHVVIDSYGACLKNKTQPVPDARWFNIYGEAKLSLMSEYFFCIAFENSRHHDYVTEKVFQALAAGCVPLYDGAPNAKLLLPHKSFIDRNDFADAADMGRYLRHLLTAPRKYAAYFEWKTVPSQVAKLEALARLGSDSGWCRLCQFLHESEGATS